ncbi:hypothetical protein DUNSADRAFT_13310 [Dunaliella salina]|uniref:Encoded protein n=1 Tax=Dunaliella salina TaxID=3046 RepID=A0ABQ7G9M0_DUNSA|nr:hypothetical protein DUNSADRAFT_13310 [Dunaliella salina]|eukprot:KAF5831309.1 hypothetical protein DUNSADRAFT_13310 [Dunaliella salina]
MCKRKRASVEQQVHDLGSCYSRGWRSSLVQGCVKGDEEVWISRPRLRSGYCSRRKRRSRCNQKCVKRNEEIWSSRSTLSGS